MNNTVVRDKLSKIKIEISKQNISYILLYFVPLFINERYQCCVIHESFSKLTDERESSDIR